MLFFPCIANKCSETLATWQKCYAGVDNSLNVKTQAAGGSKKSFKQYVNAKLAASGKTQH
jgi:hypothetical protein